MTVQVGVDDSRSSGTARNNPRQTARCNDELHAKQTKARTRFYNLGSVVLACALVAVVVYLMNILSVPVGILIWTIIIVFCLRGIVNGLEAHGVSRGLGTTVAYLVMALVLIAIIILLFTPMFGLNAQFNDLVTNLPNYVDGVMAWANDIYAQIEPMLEDETVKNFIEEAQKSIASAASTVAKGSASGVVTFGTSVVNAFIAIGFALVIAFWVLMELPNLGKETRRLFGPAHAEEAEFFYATFTRVVGGYIKATLLQCAIIGLGCGILFAIVGIPNAAVLGLITGVLNIIPVVGPWLGGALAAIVAVFVSPLAAVVAFLGTIIIQQAVYTFVSPKLMENSVDIHPALTLIALTVGSALGGAMNGLVGSLVGMLASIPLVACAKAVFVYYFEKKTGRHLVAEDGVFFKGTPSDADKVDPAADATLTNNTGAIKPIHLEDVPFGKKRKSRKHSARHEQDAREYPIQHAHDRDGRR